MLVLNYALVNRKWMNPGLWGVVLQTLVSAWRGFQKVNGVVARLFQFSGALSLRTIKVDYDENDSATAHREKIPDARMRTLLDESLPPQCIDEPMFSPAEPATPAERTFSQNAVLVSLDDLAEVGLGVTVIATPSAGAEQAKPALERGVAILETEGAFSKGAEHACPKSEQSSKATPVV